MVTLSFLAVSFSTFKKWELVGSERYSTYYTFATFVSSHTHTPFAHLHMQSFFSLSGLCIEKYYDLNDKNNDLLNVLSLNVTMVRYEMLHSFTLNPDT